MRNLLLLIITLYSTYGFSQNSFEVYHSGNLCKSYYGNIGKSEINIQIQVINDTLVNGYYSYNKYGKKIEITGFFYNNSKTGFFKGDSLHIYELNKDSSRTAILKAYSFKAEYDSSMKSWSKLLGFTGEWISLLNSNRLNLELHEQSIIDSGSTNYALVSEDSTIKYVLPISKYLSNKFRYSFENTCNEFIDGHLYSIFTFAYKPISMDQQSPTANILMYVKFGVNGVIDTVESVDMDSPTKRIAYKLNYGSFHLHDSLGLDIYRFNDRVKVHLKMNKKDLDKGFFISSDTIRKFPIYLYDTLDLQLDKEYNLIFKYLCYHIYQNSSYDYIIDSIYERDKKDISKLSYFCKDLKYMYMATSSNSKIYFGTPKTYDYDDYNFDDYNDIYIFNDEEAGANNRAQTIWLYDAKSSKYIKDKFLSSLNIWSVNAKNKTITSGWRMGAQIYNTVTYQLINGKFKKIATEESDRNDTNNTVTIIKSKLINGKWVKEEKTY